MWGWLLGLVSILEWTALGIHLTLGSSGPPGVFWAIIGCLCVQPAVYYLFTVYFACFSRGYPNCFEKIFNVAYLYTLYIECLLLKLEPADLKHAFENDGMTDINSNHRKQMLLLHLSTVSLPVEVALLYSGIATHFDLLQIVTVSVVGLAAAAYSLYCLLGGRRKRSLEYPGHRDERFQSL